MNRPETTAPLIAVVIPCYNEQEVLPISVPAIVDALDAMTAGGLIDPRSYVYCVDDGSTDATWGTINGLHERYGDRVRGHLLAHNRGHQAALLSGLMAVRDRCDAAISIDADLQDDVAAMTAMVEAYSGGAEIVYGVRRSRDTDTRFKRTSARAFYRLQQRLGLETVYDHADYRLMSARALDILSLYGEVNIFLRGIVPQIGLDTAVVYYDRRARAAGCSKYPLRKMLAFSLDGVTSFSIKPMTMIFSLGLLLLLLDVVMAAYVLVSYFSGHYIPGWSSLMISVWFLGSLVLMAIGVVGIYIGKIYMEVKHRPRYVVKETIGAAPSDLRPLP